MRIEIYHPNGHVTKVQIKLSSERNLLKRLSEDENSLGEIMAQINPQLIEGTKVYLVLKSKANAENIE